MVPLSAEQAVRRKAAIWMFGRRRARFGAALMFAARAGEAAVLGNRPMSRKDRVAVTGEGERGFEDTPHAALSRHSSASGSNSTTAWTTASDHARRISADANWSNGGLYCRDRLSPPRRFE
jgi:hypothetical protein